MASPHYSREYRFVLADEVNESSYARARNGLEAAISEKSSLQCVHCLHCIADRYYLRGAVGLLDGNEKSWHDIQAGYLAEMYSLRFLAPLSPAVRQTMGEHPNQIIGAVMALGLARLFNVAFDEHWLRNWLSGRYDLPKLTGKVVSGALILESIYQPEFEVTFAALKRDRRECCQKIDAWPHRPTEYFPFGVLDVEQALLFPESAEFPYPNLPYAPIEDDLVIEAMTAFHKWHE